LQHTSRDVIVHLHETLQTIVAPLSDIKDNLEHLHQKIDSLENTIDERLPSGTHILGAGTVVPTVPVPPVYSAPPTVPVSRTPVPIVPVSRPVPYVLAPTQPEAALLLDIACSFDETAFMHGMAAATSAFDDEVDSLEDFAPPEVHAAIVLVHSTPVPTATVLVPSAPVLTATGHYSAPAPVLNALLKHTSNVLATSSFPVPEGSSHVQTRHLWSPIDRGKSATIGYVAILLIIWKLMFHLSRTLTPNFVPLVAVPRLEEMGDDRLYIYHHMVTVSSGLASSVLLTN
jgi:hypothetical protein